MIVSISHQIQMFYYAFLIGVGSAILFDIFRSIRKVYKHSVLVTNVEDFIFWLIVTFIFFYVILLFNNGSIRVYFFVSFVIGFFMWILLLSRHFTRMLIYIIRMIDICLKKLKFGIKSIFRPIGNNIKSKNHYVVQKLPVHNKSDLIKKLIYMKKGYKLEIVKIIKVIFRR